MRTRARHAAIVTMFTITCLSLQVSAATVSDDPDARVLRVERWLKAVLTHEPGAIDDASREVATWPNASMRTLSVDESVLVQLIRDPARKTIVFPPGPKPEARPKFPYSNWQIHRLRVLACAAAGVVKTNPCVTPLDAAAELDDRLLALSERAAASRRRGDDNYVLRRGAVLHGDVAMSSEAAIDPLDGNPGRFRVQMTDGQVDHFGNGGFHWELARRLLDAIRPVPDAMTREWYIATSMWMQGREQHETDHLRHARQMFPDDPELLFLSGCQLETYAGAAIQSVVRSAVLPAGYSLDVPNETVALRDAEDFFRSALARDPQRREARLRLGHVLLARGRPQQAADELKNVDTSGEPPVLRYFHAMFFGAAEEALGHFDQARESYERAATLFDGTQSPYLALSALAMRRGDRAGALASIQPLFLGPNGDDPWWAYYVAQARNTAVLFEQFYGRYAGH